MLHLFPIFSLAQANPLLTPTFTPAPIPAPQLVVQPQEIRALPGQLNKIPMFNSNSPEVVQTEGILLSTFPPTGKTVPNAHLNYGLVGRFDLFSHHIARADKLNDNRPLYQGIIAYNPGSKPVTLDILQAASYVTNPDAPFVELPPYVDNPLGTVYSGPGSRVMDRILRGAHQTDFPSQIEIPPQESRLVFSLPIALSNCRSTFMRLRSSGPIYMASLAMYARPNLEAKKKDTAPNNLLKPPIPAFREPTLQEWEQLLNTGTLAGPRDRIPTPPDKDNGEIVYGRVAGVAQGSEWHTELVDGSGKTDLSIPPRGKAFSYAIATVPMITLGTRQVQSAPMLVRYPDTAYLAHGNYGVFYSLSLPLTNNTGQTQSVIVKIQTPLKQEERGDRLRFLEPPDRQVLFRGTVRMSYKDDAGNLQSRYIHLVQRRGQQGDSLVKLRMPPRDRRLVKVDFLYPPDSTPPQVLTVRTLDLPF